MTNACMPIPAASDFAGAITALVTPFEGEALDADAFAALVERQVGGGASGLLVAGIAGEGPTLSPAERDLLVEIAVRGAAGRPVIAATGSNGTERTIAWSRAACRAGADALLVTVPFYNRPSQEGVIRHFEAVARAVDRPILVHPAPERTAVTLAPATLARIAALPGVAGIVGGLDRLRGLTCGLSRLSDGDGDVLRGTFSGAVGGISALANVVPRLVAALHHACRAGDLGSARRLEQTLAPLAALAAEEAEGVIAKAAAAMCGGFDPAPRLPLVAASAASLTRLHALLPALRDAEAALAGAVSRGRTRARRRG